MPAMYHLVLPAPEVLAADNDMDILYQPISSTVEEEDDQIQQVPAETATELLGTAATVSLTKEDKLRLVKPLLLKYMLPLCQFVYHYSCPAC
jgi:battenin